ncbi:MAG: hypothetical protein MUE36_07425 [Acidimicrobiales bacterium]|jgi:hypothetical protein|nr:hypothetical protein [Acidimicrobiales bacterium]
MTDDAATDDATDEVGAGPAIPDHIPTAGAEPTAADDDFHPPTDDDPFWTETCWFTFTAPDHGLSGQLYPFFRPNQGVMAAAVYVWDESGDQIWNCRYAKNFWHLPIPAQPLTDIHLPNGIRYRTVEPLQRYELRFDDPDADDLHLDLTFDAVARPNLLGTSHLDQPGRYTGTIVLDGEEIAVDSYGFRDRSWGPRSQFGDSLHGATNGGYSYATASPAEGFHAITMNYGGDPASADGCIGIHGYVIRDGRWAKLTSARREVVERDPDTGAPVRVVLDIDDELGRRLHAEGRCRNRLMVALNPNLVTVNCLTEWSFDGLTAHGEDHDNWSAASIRRFLRAR